jgi:hypothetical protein
VIIPYHHLNLGANVHHCFGGRDRVDHTPYELVTRSWVVLLEASPADEAAGQRDEGVVEFGSAFPMDGKAFELVKQGEGLLHDVTEVAQALDVRGALVGDDRQDPPLAQLPGAGLES